MSETATEKRKGIIFEPGDEVRQAMKNGCRTFYKITVERTSEKVAWRSDWQRPEGSADGFYTWRPAVERESVTVFEAQVDQLEMRDVVRAMYGPIAP